MYSCQIDNEFAHPPQTVNPLEDLGSEDRLKFHRLHLSYGFEVASGVRQADAAPVFVVRNHLKFGVVEEGRLLAKALVLLEIYRLDFPFNVCLFSFLAEANAG